MNPHILDGLAPNFDASPPKCLHPAALLDLYDLLTTPEQFLHTLLKMDEHGGFLDAIYMGNGGQIGLSYTRLL
jgi:hypothetical protein